MCCLGYRDSIAFATEPITASLANLLGHHDNLPTPVPPTIKVHSAQGILCTQLSHNTLPCNLTDSWIV